jgi:hypothetical protein
MTLFNELAQGIGTRMKIIGAVFGVFGLVVAADYADRSANYEQTDARLVSVKFDCYVEGGRKKVVEKSSGEMAYMDCGLAPFAAEQFGHSKDDIKRRATLRYVYRSPVDGTQQSGLFTHMNAPKYSVGQRVTIYAHTSTPDKSRFF